MVGWEHILQLNIQKRNKMTIFNEIYQFTQVRINNCIYSKNGLLQPIRKKASHLGHFEAANPIFAHMGSFGIGARLNILVAVERDTEITIKKKF